MAGRTDKEQREQDKTYGKGEGAKGAVGEEKRGRGEGQFLGVGTLSIHCGCLFRVMNSTIVFVKNAEEGALRFWRSITWYDGITLFGKCDLGR